MANLTKYVRRYPVKNMLIGYIKMVQMFKLLSIHMLSMDSTTPVLVKHTLSLVPRMQAVASS